MRAQECTQVMLLWRKQEFIEIEKHDPDAFAAKVFEAVAIDRQLSRGGGAVKERRFSRRRPGLQDRHGRVGAVVVVQIEMLDADEFVKAQPLLQVRRFVSENGTQAQ